ncbi:MAG: tRNA (adenosine(37)-N6)-threonylcarbamoyltransferase complex ATPase subunit type 1 TsaE [Spirosomataceae bacterium]
MSYKERNMELHYHKNEIEAVAKDCISKFQSVPVWLFEGEMGAGKTTFIRALCTALGVSDTVQSPTFGLVNEYSTHEGETLYHFDCYRLENPSEALDLGIDEYLYSGNLCFIEWPSRIEPHWPSKYVSVSLQTINEEERILNIFTVGI